VPLVPGDVISYLDTCREEKASLQRGMNFRLHPSHSVVLMSLRPGAPYADAVVDNGKPSSTDNQQGSRLHERVDPPRDYTPKFRLAAG